MGSRYGKKAYVNGLLIALNVLFFLYLEITDSSEDAYFMYTKGAMFAPTVLEDGEYYRLLTAMFMHFGIRHIMNNMLVLFVIGDNLERALGHVKYLIFYLLCGIGSNYNDSISRGIRRNFWSGRRPALCGYGQQRAVGRSEYKTTCDHDLFLPVFRIYKHRCGQYRTPVWPCNRLCACYNFIS